MLTQDQLESEIRAWSSEALETKQDNGHATCPYAKNTWNKQKVKILKSKDIYWEDLFKCALDFPKDYDVVIYCDFNVDLPVEVFDDRLNLFNTLFSKHNLWLMGFHQDHTSKSIVESDDFEPMYEDAYNMVFMQGLKELNNASQNLADLGYYSNWTKEEYDNILIRWSIQNEEK